MNTVLVVDDEPEILTMLCLMLNSEGFKTYRASNGHEAIDISRQSPIDVVITDMRMPDMDGIEVIRQLSKLDKNVAAIILTAYGDLDTAVRAFQLNSVCNYLTKPLENPSVLFAAVKGAMEKRRLQLENKELISRLKNLNRDLKKEVAAHFQDISELRQVQEHIRLSKIMLQSVFDGISNPLIMVDRNMTVRMFNRAAKNYYLIDDFKELLGKKCNDLMERKPQCNSCKISRYVASGQATVFERPGYMDPEKIETVTIYPLAKSATGLDGAIIQITDITETKALERQMIQNEKLASLGMLVSGVAHEINNPNNFLTFNIPILKSYMKAIMAHVSRDAKAVKAADWFGMSFDEFSDEVFKLIGNLEHGTHRITDIVSNLRTMVNAETGRRSRQPCRITKIVSHVDSQCRGEVQKFVKTFEVQCPDDLPLVESDPAALEQVLINLLINAAHAVNKPESRIKLTVSPLKDDILEIVVEDNGVGMDDETLKKIFDPFFTTKDPGLGTGLGLSICHSLINSLQGTLKVKSKLNSGTAFHLALPVKVIEQFDLPGDTSAKVVSEKITALPAR